MATPPRQDKEAFFDALYALDRSSPSDDGTEDDEAKQALLSHLQRSDEQTVPVRRPPKVDVLNTPVLPQKSHLGPAIKKKKVSHGLLRMHSEPDRIVNTYASPAGAIATGTAGEKSIIKNTPLLQKSTTVPETILRDPSTRLSSLLRDRHPIPSSTIDTPTVTDMARKRKRAPPPQKMAPLARRVFRGLTFFFLPNNDISPARRMRIAKAIEYGAVWAKEWTDEVSHMILDRDLCYNDVLSFLKLDRVPVSLCSCQDQCYTKADAMLMVLPKPNVILVNESYPADCIQFLAMIPPSQSRHQVRGAPPFPKANAAPKEPAASPPPPPSSSEHSLQLKPATRSYAPPPETPSQSGNSGGSLPLDELASPVSYISSLASPDKLRFRLLKGSV